MAAKQAVTKVVKPVGQNYFARFCEWYKDLAGYRKYGLRVNDLLIEDDKAVAEAIKRLPEEEQNLRMFRIKRALDISMKGTILPEDQWTKPEEDIPYLQDMVSQVEEEIKEKNKWDRM